MKHGKNNRNTDLENVVHELNKLKKRVRDYEKIFQTMKLRNKQNNYWCINAKEHIHQLEKKVKQLTREVNNEV